MTQTQPASPNNNEVEAVRWSILAPEFLREWQPGEHVAIFGRTGTGKTTIAVDLLNGAHDRKGARVIALGTKLRDPVLTKLGWPIIREWPPTYEQREGGKLVYWPPYPGADDPKRREANAKRFALVLNELLYEGGWVVYLDEAIYFTETLGLRGVLDEYWNTARSAGVTLVASSQGVTWIPRAVRTQPSWMFMFQIRDEETRMDAAKVTGDRTLYGPMSKLRGHEFLLVSAESGQAYVSKVGT
jgi:energy-coupling factor transporter ATP-binding protein EcfA2